MKTILFIFLLAGFLIITRYRFSDSLSCQGEGFDCQYPDSPPLFPKKSPLLTLAMAGKPKSEDTGHSDQSEIKLPDPHLKGSMSVEEAIKLRRTERSFLPDPLSQQQLSQILWAALGITEEGGDKRSVPSAGALNPLDIFVVVGKEGIHHLEEGVYHYLPAYHQLRRITSGDLRKQIADAALGQTWISHAPADIIITAEYARTTGKYGARGVRYVHMEAGHVAQNIFLQAVALKLGAGIVGAFSDDKLKNILKLPTKFDPLLIMPFGKAK